MESLYEKHVWQVAKCSARKSLLCESSGTTTTIAYGRNPLENESFPFFLNYIRFLEKKKHEKFVV